MKKIFYLLLLLSFFICSCNNVTKTPQKVVLDEQVIDQPPAGDEKSAIIPDSLQEEDSIEQVEILNSRVHRVAQKNFYSSQNCHSIPLVLLDNGDVLSEDNDILYLLRPGDSVYYSGDGEIIKIIFADKKTKGRS